MYSKHTSATFSFLVCRSIRVFVILCAMNFYVMFKAAALLDKLGRSAEASAMREELKARYPNAAEGKTI